MVSWPGNYWCILWCLFTMYAVCNALSRRMLNISGVFISVCCSLCFCRDQLVCEIGLLKSALDSCVFSSADDRKALRLDFHFKNSSLILLLSLFSYKKIWTVFLIFIQKFNDLSCLFAQYVNLWCFHDSMKLMHKCNNYRAYNKSGGFNDTYIKISAARRKIKDYVKATLCIVF